ncbi:MAG: UDP-N-acetylglucosamine 1-carboxyvinyltransferase [Candidatus Reconcilbacillus cellulovorans]|uniref:UDP-N-acetylglucosamine 1-carboxyvinyltransferase n=1 Tax=Candidatus Reconcilbacillus cellulovorans TaxID=1906605 RepID=A0A2A6E2N6_9BACL|nr:MAG: UDP-N-acetylglucosamine 1-carboxyvinyltransferase [Candidatus Reconcilbacillus cellulovorans]
MEKLLIDGGYPLAGKVRVHGAKNAALPIMAASLLIDGPVVIRNVPDLLDIRTMLSILRELGCRTEMEKDAVTVNAGSLKSFEIPETLMSRMRSSIFLMGPLLAKFGEVHVYPPGGCAIGERKIDLHLQGLRALGAEIEQKGGKIVCRAKKLVGADIALDYPSVGATENIMMAAVLAEGRTTIVGAAREPEIQDLQNFLNAMGARVVGAGTDTITVDGLKRLNPGAGAVYAVIPDRIVAGTLMIAAAATRGDIELEGVTPGHLTSVVHALRLAGVQVEIENDRMQVRCPSRPIAVERIVTAPHPGFPTDLQAQMMALLASADGVSIIKETVFNGRFRHVHELCRMGADIRVDGSSAFIRGVPRLHGATVEATDLRAGAALVIAGLAADGRTSVEQIHHIDRGYDRIERVLAGLGAKIQRYVQAAESLNV